MRNTKKPTGTGSSGSIRSLGATMSFELAINIIFVIIFFIIISRKMNKDYKVLSTHECMEYIERYHVDLKDNNWDYSIPSMKGIIYTLPNGEFVLVPSNFKASYPGIIFRDSQVFMKYAEKDSFPIDKEHMSWLEAHMPEIESFGTKDTISTYENISEMEAGYNRLLQFVKNDKDSDKSKDSAVNIFGLSVIKFFLKENIYSLKLERRYEMYNPYYYPLLVRDGKNIDVLSKLYIALKNGSANSFQLFYNFIIH